MKQPTYVVTVKYGKEKFAEQELGDAIFPLDPKVKILPTPHKGVLVVYTSLNHEKFMARLKAFPPATVERVVRISFCCEHQDLTECVKKGLSETGINFSKVRPGRKGRLSKEKYNELSRLLKELASPHSRNTLLVEPINGLVCFGVVEDDADKFRLFRLSRIPNIDQAF